VRVLLAADSALVRAGLQAVIGGAGPRLTLAGAATPLGTVIQAAEKRHPDVVLLALEDQEEQLALITALSGRPAFRRPAVEEPGRGGPAVVVLAEAALARNSLRRGARAFLPPDSSGEEIVAAVVAASSGLVALVPDALELLLGQPRDLSPSSPPDSWDGPPPETLTPREVEVLGMLAEGLGNKEIAARLRISEHTVKFHVGSILGKLGAASRTEAVSRGLRRGLIIL